MLVRDWSILILIWVPGLNGREFFLKKCVILFGSLTHYPEFRKIKSSKTNQNATDQVQKNQGQPIRFRHNDVGQHCQPWQRICVFFHCWIHTKTQGQHHNRTRIDWSLQWWFQQYRFTFISNTITIKIKSHEKINSSNNRNHFVGIGNLHGRQLVQFLIKHKTGNTHERAIEKSKTGRRIDANGIGKDFRH